ncbi:hypothetical protein M9H77_05248 [Catharanthus roseus]|uniref:Uncharacterized protein n=1 Tax=Catharanthus roseus TaxID=4058 RepID=A0ACC0CGE9_CATRO|nr:hypothetical protein M9H77_05248 [Catharanthus roseus]
MEHLSARLNKKHARVGHNHVCSSNAAKLQTREETLTTKLGCSVPSQKAQIRLFQSPSTGEQLSGPVGAAPLVFPLIYQERWHHKKFLEDTAEVYTTEVKTQLLPSSVGVAHGAKVFAGRLIPPPLMDKVGPLKLLALLTRFESRKTTITVMKSLPKLSRRRLNHPLKSRQKLYQCHTTERNSVPLRNFE